MNNIQNKKEIPTMMKPVLIGCAAGAVATFLILLVFALVLTMKDMPSGAMTIMSSTAAGIGALVAGFCASKLYGKNGLFIGGISGLVLFAMVLLISMIISSSGFSVYSLFKLLIMVVFAAIGGVMGVNF